MIVINRCHGDDRVWKWEQKLSRAACAFLGSPHELIAEADDQLKQIIDNKPWVIL